MLMFKEGDLVKVLDNDGGKADDFEIGETVKIVMVDNDDYDQPYKAEKLDGSDYYWFHNGQLRKIGKDGVKSPKFILQYEIDGDPIEEFNTLNEVKSRIKKLYSEGGNSFIVYEVKKMFIPHVEKKEVITIKGI